MLREGKKAEGVGEEWGVGVNENEGKNERMKE